MSKKIIALSIMLLSVLLILFSAETVTARGVLDGKCTLYQTISPFGFDKYFNLLYGEKIQFEWLGIISFFIGISLLFVPNFLLFEQSKIKTVILAIINIIGISILFFFYKSYSYMLMMIVVCILIACDVLVQFIKDIKNKIDMLVVILTSFILVGNCYYLFVHLTKRSLWEMWSIGDNLFNEMEQISRINIFCFALWLIPYGILLIKEIITTYKTSRTVD